MSGSSACADHCNSRNGNSTHWRWGWQIYTTFPPSKHVTNSAIKAVIKVINTLEGMKAQREKTSQLSMPRTKSIRTILAMRSGANTSPQNLWFHSFLQPQNYRGAESILPGFELVVPGRAGAELGDREGRAHRANRKVHFCPFTHTLLGVFLLHSAPSVI